MKNFENKFSGVTLEFYRETSGLELLHFPLELQGTESKFHDKKLKYIRYKLEAIARQPLNKDHRDYSHGTGHGIGYYLLTRDCKICSNMA